MHEHKWETVVRKPCLQNENLVELRCTVCSARKFIELNSEGTRFEVLVVPMTLGDDTPPDPDILKLCRQEMGSLGHN